MPLKKDQLLKSLEKGVQLPKGKRILHTAPHHDDILLGYHPMLKKLIRDNENFFAYVTSGFNSVTDDYILRIFNSINNNDIEQITSLTYEFILKSFLDAVRLKDNKAMEYWEKMIFLRNMTAERNILKGAMRESESDRKLLMLNVDLSRVYHMRSKFYSEKREMNSEDISQFLELLDKVQPDVITIAADVEGKGPATHHKVFQLICKALEMWDAHQKITIWCYRNVWSRYHLSESDIIVPVTDEELHAMNNTFLNCFPTQVNAAFPNPEFKGPFSGLAEKIMREQYLELKKILGDSYFDVHPVLKQAAGMIYLQERSGLCI